MCTCITDCKLLQFIFSPRSKPSARIERWVFGLQPCRYRVVHIPGSTNIANSLSRLLTTQQSEKVQCNELHDYVVNIARLLRQRR